MHDQITWMTRINNNQSNECLQVTQKSRELRQKLYNKAKFVGVVVGDVVGKNKDQNFFQKFYFHNIIFVSDSKF